MTRQTLIEPSVQRRLSKPWRIFGVVGVALCFTLLMHIALSLAGANNPSMPVALAQSEPNHGGDGHGDDFVVRTGVLITRPEEKIGTWVISRSEEISFTVVERTLVEAQPAVGDCVEVKLFEDDDEKIALAIRVKDDDDCQKDDGGDDHGGKDERIVDYGIIVSRPVEGKVGTWVIGGVAYSATEQTRLDFDYGRLIVGGCAKVTSLKSEPTVAREIESERGYKCRRGDDHLAKNRLFGVVQSVSDDLQNGIWTIGGSEFVVSPTTELVRHGKEFTPGVTVKVDFVTDISETNFALRIEIIFGLDNPCQNVSASNADIFGHDGLRYGHCPGHEGKSIGRIERRPTGSLLGAWIIGGIPYTTNAFTKFFPGNDFLVGERVKVEYVVLSPDVRIATKIMEIGNAGIGGPNSSLIVGYVDTKPAAFVGDWMINGAPFVAVSDTIFIERGVLFAPRAYVVVEYHITNDQRVIDRILSYMPPGAGDENAVGPLQSMGTVAVAEVNSLQESSAIWTINNVEYIVNDATMLIDEGGELAVGATVFVNSYTADGQRYATTVRTQGGRQLIPIVTK